MLAVTPEYLEKLNSQYRGGMFLRAVDLVGADPDGNTLLQYFVDHSEPITFNGNTYVPLRMSWDNLKTSQSMPMDGCTVTVSNVGPVGILMTNYLKTIDITDNEVTLRLLHLDLLSQTTGHWQRRGFILAVQGDASAVTFTVGRRLGRSVLPRKVFLANEWPGLTAEVARIFG